MLTFDPRSSLYVELWPRVMIPRWNVTLGHDYTLNCDPESWFDVELWPRFKFHVELWPASWFNVKLWHEIGITIQCGILARGHNSTWKFEPGLQFNVELWPGVIIQCGFLTPLHVELRLKKVSKFKSVIKIQQLKRVTIQRKIHWILTPGWFFYLISAYTFQVFDFPIIDLTKFAWIKYSWSRTRVFRPHPPRDESRDKSKKSPFFDKVLF